MRSVIVSWLFTLRASLRDRAAMQLEIFALRHQLQVLERTRVGCANPISVTLRARTRGAALKGSEMRSGRKNILVHETAQSITTLNLSIK